MRVLNFSSLFFLILIHGSAWAGDDMPWYRGNTHVHTVLCGHADSAPEVVAKWYLDRGYNFLCLSEHNRFINPDEVKLPENRRKDFILVPGEEVTGTMHMTALDIHNAIPPLFAHLKPETSGAPVIQAYVDKIREESGVPIINHPNWKWILSHADIRPVKNCFLFELHNGHTTVNNEGDATHPSTEAIWDTLLTDGMIIYGASSDDAHTFKKLGHQHSNPGRGWVMVKAPELTSKAIATAMDQGNFYASSGVLLKQASADPVEQRILVDEAATKAEIAKDFVNGRRLRKKGNSKISPGFKIEFIGPEGKVLHSVNGPDATYTNDPKVAYVRGKVTLTVDGEKEFVQHYAWTQPFFNDSRSKSAKSVSQ
jgi:hypothetical protein